MKAEVVTLLLWGLADGAAVTHGDPATSRRSLVPRSDSGSFSLKQIENKKFKGHDGAAALMRAHIKYAQKLPDAVSKALDVNPELRAKLAIISIGEVGQQGTVESMPSPNVDSEYAIEVQIGTPPQPLPLNLDTGSADFWTFSTDTDPSVVNGQALYQPASSSSSKRLDGETWHIRYGDSATAEGIVYTDTVRIGDTDVEGQAIEAAMNVSASISQDTFVSGILGMASSGANTVRPTPQRTYIDNVKDRLAMPLFTANLKARSPGNYNFGYIDESEYIGPIQYADVDRYTPFWKIACSGFRIGQSPEQDFRIDGIVDTGTSLLLLPEPIVEEYYRRLPGAFRDPRLGMIVFPCIERPPDFFIVIGSYSGRIPGDYMNYGQVNPFYCFGGLQTSQGLPFAVLGDVLLKAQFVVFDYGNVRVGFANKDV